MLPNNLSLNQMIRKINKSVSDEKWQLSDPKNTLTKEVVFTPKKVRVTFLYTQIIKVYLNWLENDNKTSF